MSGRICLTIAAQRAHVRWGSKPAVLATKGHFRFAPQSRPSERAPNFIGIAQTRKCGSIPGYSIGWLIEANEVGWLVYLVAVRLVQKVITVACRFRLLVRRWSLSRADNPIPFSRRRTTGFLERLEKGRMLLHIVEPAHHGRPRRALCWPGWCLSLSRSVQRRSILVDHAVEQALQQCEPWRCFAPKPSADSDITGWPLRAIAEVVWLAALIAVAW